MPKGLSVIPKPLPWIVFRLSIVQPTVTSELGTINNLIQVKKSDFEVFDALQVDSLECSDTSGHSNHVTFKKRQVLNLNLLNGHSCSGRSV